MLGEIKPLVTWETRIDNPKMCHCGIRIILSLRPLSRYKNALWLSSIFFKNKNGIDLKGISCLATINREKQSLQATLDPYHPQMSAEEPTLTSFIDYLLSAIELLQHKFLPQEIPNAFLLSCHFSKNVLFFAGDVI